MPALGGDMPVTTARHVRARHSARNRGRGDSQTASSLRDGPLFESAFSAEATLDFTGPAGRLGSRATKKPDEDLRDYDAGAIAAGGLVMEQRTWPLRELLSCPSSRKLPIASRGQNGFKRTFSYR